MTIWQQPDFVGRIEAAWHELDAGVRGEAAEVILAAMKLGGVDRLWFVSGSELTFFQEAAAKAKALGRPAPEIMTMIHEHAALSAAIGDAMISGRPSAACAHVELGLLNMGGAIHVASRGNYPVLIITGAPASAYPGTGPGARSQPVFWKQQIRDQGELVRQYTKWDYKLAPYDNAGLTITRALQVALSKPYGPAYLALPRESGQAPIQGIQRFPTLAQLTPASSPAADPDLIRQAARLLLAAEAPLMLTERIGRHQAALAPFQELCELLSAKVIAPNFNYNFPQPHPLRIDTPEAAAAAKRAADVVLMVDHPTPWLPGQDGPPAGAKVIGIDLDPIQQSIPIWEFPADLRITADSGLALPALLAEVKRLLTPEDIIRLDARRERAMAEGRAANAAYAEAVAGDGALGHITARWAVAQLGALIDDNTVVVGEGGTMFEPGGAMVALPRSAYGSVYFHGSSHLGFALAGCVGGKKAAPDRRFVAVVGDGVYNFALASQTFWAAHYHHAPFVTLILNNRGYSTGTVNLRNTYPNGYAVKAENYEGGFFDPPPDYVAEARAAGCQAEKVERPEDLRPALERAFAATGGRGVCSVIDVWLPRHITGTV